MCGIFGAIVGSPENTNLSHFESLIDNLFINSETRGKDSAGLATFIDQKLAVFKKDLPAHQFIKEPKFKEIKGSLMKSSALPGSAPLSFIGHCRMVTNGAEENPANNQPVVKYGSAIVHNGIICNVEDLWQKQKGSTRTAEVDTEILLELMKDLEKNTGNFEQVITNVFSTIEGSASIAYVSEGLNSLILASNTGSLFFAIDTFNRILCFSSERYILSESLQKSGFDLSKFQIVSVGSRKAFAIHFSSFEVKEFALEYHAPTAGQQLPQTHSTSHSLDGGLVFRWDQIKSLKRCSKCILPETFPFIEFDEKGECNYCANYQPSSATHKTSELKDKINKAKESQKSEFDCIVPFSGGRDSSYGLHFLVKELGVKPITYTYDWGMVTDLARRNISRICAELGIENILISADIKRKRANIKKNVSAWLRNPELGMVPLFMAGDKQFLYYVNKIKEQTNVAMDIWMPNRLENTDFKTGFCGIRPQKKGRIDALGAGAKFQMLSYYGQNFLKNPAYLNSSLLDSVFAYFSYYFEPRNNYTVLFDYIPWNESLINSTLVQKYNWELSPDSPSTWRIGDGTAPFYNYIYFTMAGFSEYDTFRSNQIREGMITREEALKFVETENQPRHESLKWYLNTINLDFDDTIKIINSQPTLY